jgi:hypothetical protein
VKEEKTINAAGRKIVTTYTLDNGYRVRVATYHYSNSKSIRTMISECIARFERGYTMETHRVFSDYSANLLSESVSRYSFKVLEDQHARGLEVAAPIVAELLAAGKENARECQKEAA